MKFLIRLGLSALVLLCLVALLLMVATRGQALESILYEDLTCQELIWGYEFNRAVLDDMLQYHNGCLEFANSPASVNGKDLLACKFIREHGVFVQGIVNDIVNVYNIKCADE